MNDLLAYPPSSPRLVTTPAARDTAEPYLAASSPAARARWRLAGSPVVGRWLWRAPSPEVAAAWETGLGLLGDRAQAVVGVLGEDGPEQRLTLIPAEEDVVVKVAVRPTADAWIERERACLLELPRTRWSDLGPRVHDRTSASDRGVLVIDRIAGGHPAWDDTSAHAALLDSLDGVHHGDVTPWNVVRTGTGRFVLLDWELADLGAKAEPLCGVLDFVLRGAAAAHAPVARARPAVLAAIGSAETPAEGALELYRAYRARVRELSRGRPDGLSRDADRLLAACLGAR